MKNKRFVVVFLILIAILSIDSISSLTYFKYSVEERISNTIQKEQFSTVEFEDGYICIYPSKIGDDDCLYFTYLKKKLFSNTGFNLRALIADDLNYYLSNRNIQSCFTLPLNNFSNHTIYFSCCEKQFSYPIEVNGEQLELHEVMIKKGTETYSRVFWFYLGEDKVYPKIRKIGDDSVP